MLECPFNDLDQINYRTGHCVVFHHDDHGEGHHHCTAVFCLKFDKVIIRRWCFKMRLLNNIWQLVPWSGAAGTTDQGTQFVSNLRSQIRKISQLQIRKMVHHGDFWHQPVSYAFSLGLDSGEGLLMFVAGLFLRFRVSVADNSLI